MGGVHGFSSSIYPQDHIPLKHRENVFQHTAEQNRREQVSYKHQEVYNGKDLSSRAESPHLMNYWLCQTVSPCIAWTLNHTKSITSTYSATLHTSGYLQERVYIHLRLVWKISFQYIVLLNHLNWPLRFATRWLRH